MGFLADFNRSGAAQVGQGLLGQVQQLGQMQVQGAQQNLANTMAVGKYATEMQKNKLQIEELEKKNKTLNEPRDVKSSVLYLSLPEEAREPFLKSYIAGGYADENGITTMAKRNQFLAESKEGVSLYFDGLKLKASKGLDSAIQKLDKAREGGDPDAIKKAEGVVQYWSAQSASAQGKAKEALESMGMGKAEAPKSREIKVGEEIVTQEWTGSGWKDVSTAPRYKPQEGGEGGSSVKDSELRQQLKEMLGLSDFLSSAKDPENREKFEQASALASDIRNHPEGYGLPKDAGAGAIAKRALDITRKMAGTPNPQVPERPPIESFGGGKR